MRGGELKTFPATFIVLEENNFDKRNKAKLIEISMAYDNIHFRMSLSKAFYATSNNAS